jgi:hypothetical protein
MKNIPLFILATFLFLATPIFASSSSDDSTGKDDTQVYPIYKNVELVSTLKIQYDKPRIVIKSVYPQLQNVTAGGDRDNDNDDEEDDKNDALHTFNDIVLGLIQEKIAEFKTQVMANQDSQKRLPKPQLKNDLYLDYDTSFMQAGKSSLISIRFSSQGYVAGMAHPYHHHFVLNYDLNSDQQLELTMLFNPRADYLTILSNYTQMTLSKRHLPDQEMIAQGTAPKPENFRNWNIKPNGLLITFDEYQVAPYVNGTQTILVPYSLLKPIINPNSPIAKCVMYKKQCSRTNLLTGGFIDEAMNLRRINSRHGLLNPTLSKL